MNNLEKTFVRGLYYTNKEMKKAEEEGNLLNLDLDMSNLCNLKCIYCDKTSIGEGHHKKKDELLLNEYYKIIKQSKELGCKNLQFIGAGEPMLDPNFWKIIEFASELKILSVVYTNGTMINEENSRRLFELNTSLVLKYNSFDDKIQDELVGVKGYGEKVRKSLDILIDSKFNKQVPPRLAIDCIATNLNKKDIIPLFKFCRENNISPQFSGLIPHGEALERRLVLNKEEYSKIYSEAKEYDENNGLRYPPQLPFLGGFQCKQIKYGLYIDVKGDVWECNAGELHLGNIRKSELKDLWLSEKAKNFRKKWNCGNCHIREKYWRKQDDKRKS
jgi:MoaA/NifB/PqqE/SkfB family radical SAM enzyme